MIAWPPFEVTQAFESSGYSSLIDGQTILADPAEYTEHSRSEGVFGEIFCGDAVDCGAVFECEGGEAGLFENGDGAADGIVQGARGVVGAGDAIGEHGRAGS